MIEIIRRVVIGVIWLAFLGYVLWLGPLDQPETYPIVGRLLTFQVWKVNAYLFAIFWLMGVLPMIYAGLMFADGRMQRIPALPYFIAANGTGVLAMTPYLLLRDRNHDFRGAKDDWLQLLDSHKIGFILSGITAGLVGFALLFGDWQDFVYQWQTIPFVHLITLDFCLINLFLPLSSLLDDDLARRGWNDRRIFWAIALLPLVGSLTYLCVRPPLKESRFLHSQLKT